MDGEQLDVFHNDDTRRSFEDYARENGGVWWMATDLMQFLGYESFASFRKAVQKGISACATLGIAIEENFVQIFDARKSLTDYKLTRFACYLCAMNGDVRKPQVAAAQAYFATMAESYRQLLQQADSVERVLIRDEITEQEKSLITLANRSGVENYAFFQNAGYRGLYNMSINELRRRKGIPERRSPLDFMGKTELAANLFRITQTEEKIKGENVRGQQLLERTAEDVGREVRSTMKRISGVAPEHLPSSDDIQQVRKGLKSAERDFKKLDRGGKRKKGE